MTPIEIAFLNGRQKVARVLRKKGADASAEFLRRLTPEERNEFDSFGLPGVKNRLFHLLFRMI
jgi:hypothetical protein